MSKKPHKVQGGIRGTNGRHFGSGRPVKVFRAVLKNGRTEFVSIGWLSSYNLPKVRAWWKSNVCSYERTK